MTGIVEYYFQKIKKTPASVFIRLAMPVYKKIS